MSFPVKFTPLAPPRGNDARAVADWAYARFREIGLILGGPIRPVELVDSLPPQGEEVGQIIFNLGDGVQYQWDGTAWVPIIAGLIETSQLADFIVTEQKLKLTTHFIDRTNLVVLDNTPQIGHISWSGLRIVYKGVEYQIQDGSTNKRYAYWAPTASTTALQTSDGLPVLGEDDLIVFVNANGAHLTVPTTTVMHGSLLVEESVTANAIAANTITGDKIAANTILGTHIQAGQITAAHIAVAQLSALSANLGEITAGLLRDSASRFNVDLGNALLTVVDNQAVPRTRVRLGKLGTGVQDYGVEVYSAAGNLVLGASGLGAYVVGSQNIDGAARSQHGVFLEAFEALPSTWNHRAGSGTESIVAGAGVAGGNVYQAAGQVWKAFPSNIPFDPSKLYRMRVRVRRTATVDPATQRFYCGVEGVAADGVTLVNNSGQNLFSSQHYIVASGEDASAWPLNQWMEFTGWFKGHGTPRKAPDPTNPAGLHQNVRYFRPLFILNYDNGPAGNVMQLDYMAIDVFDEDGLTRTYLGLGSDGVVAAGKVVSSSLLDGAVTTTKLGDGAVTTVKLGNAVVTTEKLGDQSVTEAKIGNSAVTVTKLADGTVTQVKMASGLRVPEIVSSLPAPGTQGRLVFLTTDNKLYRDTGTAWTAAVPTADLTGQITTTQITDGAISTPKLAAGAVTAAKIAAGTITSNEIAANTITAGNIAAGAIGADEIAAGAVVAGKIAAGAVSTAELAAGAVTTDKLAAGAVVADKIAANAIQSSHIAAGQITAAHLAADSVTAGAIAAGAVSTAELAAGAVTTDKLAAGAVTAGKIAAGAVDANEIADELATLLGGVPIGGVWPDNITINQKGDGTANNGEVDYGGANVFTHPNGSQYSVPSNAETITSMEGVGSGYVGTYYLMFVGSDRSRFTMSSGLDLDQYKWFVATRLRNGVWEYDTNVGTAPFTPNPNDCIVAKIERRSNQSPGIESIFRYARHSIQSQEIRDSAIVASKIAAGAVVAGKIAAGAVDATNISVSQLSAISANLGEVTAGRLRSPDQKFDVDLSGQLVTIKDAQSTPKTRVRLGKLGTGAQDYGIEIYSASGNEMIRADGNAGRHFQQFDGVTPRPLLRGHLSGQAKHGEQVTFPQNFQTVPMVLIYGGISYEPRSAKWNNGLDTAKPQYDDMAAENLTAAGFKVRAQLRQKGFISQVTHNFPANNVLSIVGATVEVTLSSAPASDSRYRVHYSVAMEHGFIGETGTSTLTVAVDSGIFDGVSTTWTERVTRNYSITGETAQTWSHEQPVFVVSGLDSNDKIRLRIVSLDTTAGEVSFSVHGFDGSDDPAPGVGVDYTVSTDSFASKTPDADDFVTWEAIEVAL